MTTTTMLSYENALTEIRQTLGAPDSITPTDTGRIARWGGLTVEDDGTPVAIIGTDSTGESATLSLDELRDLLRAIR